MTAKLDASKTAPLLFACSGGSDVGNLADLAARELTRQGRGKMYCLAGVGARVEPILATTRAAPQILALDGCAQNCARKTLEQAGFSGFAHVQLNDLGLVKGQSRPTPERVRLVADKAGDLLR